MTDTPERPSVPDPIPSRVEILDRIQFQAHEIAQLFVDVDHWNRNHGPDEQIDPDPDGLMRRLYDSLCACLTHEWEHGGGLRMVRPLP